MANQMNTQVAASGKKEELVMHMTDTKIVNTFDGHGLIHYAASEGKQEEAVKALFEAYFTDLANISDIEDLLKIADKIGLDIDKTCSVLESSEYADEVRGDIKQAASLGIRGAPLFVIDDTYGISGAQGVESFKEALQKAWNEKNTPCNWLARACRTMCVPMELVSRLKPNSFLSI